jgi:hypothetical protein
MQKLRISPDAAFSVNDWTAFVIFIVVIGGIGRMEGPLIGTMVCFLVAWLVRRSRSLVSDVAGGLRDYRYLDDAQRHCGIVSREIRSGPFPASASSSPSATEEQRFNWFGCYFGKTAEATSQGVRRLDTEYAVKSGRRFPSHLRRFSYLSLHSGRSKIAQASSTRSGS